MLFSCFVIEFWGMFDICGLYSWNVFVLGYRVVQMCKFLALVVGCNLLYVFIISRGPVGRALFSFVWVVFVVILLFLYGVMLCVVCCGGLVGLLLFFECCFRVFCVCVWVSGFVCGCCR